MHCLEVIVERNEYAAGREYAHAVNDGRVPRAWVPMDEECHKQFMASYRAGYKEG